jgi:biotin carboxylase
VLFVNIRKSSLEHRAAIEAAHRLDHDVVVIGGIPPHLPERLVAAAYEVDTGSDAELDAAVVAVAASHRVTGVTTWSDAGVEPAARVASRLGLPGITPAAARLARNKGLMREALVTRPDLIPRFARVSGRRDAEAAAAAIGVPGVLKPAAGSGSKGIFRIEHPGQVVAAYDQLARLTRAGADAIFRRDPGDLVYEELLVGTEHSVEGVVHRGRVHIAGITDKWTSEPYRLELAHRFPSTLDPAATTAVRELTTAVLGILGFDDCAFHLECIHGAAGTKLVEVAARAGGDYIGSHLVGLATGRPFCQDVVGVALDRPPAAAPGPPLTSGMHKIVAPAGGELRGFGGLDRALAVPGVQHVAIDRRPGAMLRLPPEHFSSCLVGAVLATGDSAPAVWESLRSAVGAVHLDIAGTSRRAAPAVSVPTYGR